MKKPPLRVLIYLSYAFEKVSGELRSVIYMLENLDQGRFESIVVVPFYIDSLNSNTVDGVSVSVIEPPLSLRKYGGILLKSNLHERLRAILDLFQHTRRMVRFIRSQRIDVVYCCSLRAVIMVGMAARLAGVPVLFLVNGRLNNAVLDTFAFTIAGRIVFQCRANLEDRYPLLRKLFRRKLVVVDSGIDLDVIRHLQLHPPVPIALGVDPGNINIIVLGLLNPEKGVHHLFDALSKLKARLNKVRLWVVGDQITEDFNNYRARLENHAIEIGLGDVIRFTGWRTDAIQLLSVMDVLVHPSLSEGMPRAVLEAMALGKAVVATRVGCCREIIRDGENGLLVNPGDVPQLAEALGRLLEDGELRRALGMAAAATIANNHNIVVKTRDLENIIAMLAGTQAMASSK